MSYIIRECQLFDVNLKKLAFKADKQLQLVIGLSNANGNDEQTGQQEEEEAAENLLEIKQQAGSLEGEEAIGEEAIEEPETEEEANTSFKIKIAKSSKNNLKLK